MARRFRGKQGFTLMELMIVVAILGILAAIAVPTFIMLMNRSKTAEATANVNNMFKSAAAYFSQERSDRAGSVSTNCIVGDSGADPASPDRSKQRMSGSNTIFRTIGFSVGDDVYFSYELHSKVPAGVCGIGINDPDVYTFTALGDLDGDDENSTFELATGTDAESQLYHSVGFYIANELE